MATLEDEHFRRNFWMPWKNPQLFDGYLQIMNKNMNATNQEGYTMTAYLYVPKQPERLSEFVDLRHRQDKTKFPLGKSVVITEKLAENLGLKAGDTLRVQSVTASDARDRAYRNGHLRELCVQLYLCFAKYMSERREKPCEFTQLVARTNPEGTENAIQNCRSFPSRCRRLR